MAILVIFMAIFVTLLIQVSDANGCPRTYPYKFNQGRHCCKRKRNGQANLLLPSNNSCTTKQKRRLAKKNGFECCKHYVACTNCISTSIATPTAIKPTTATTATTATETSPCPATHPYVYYNGRYCCQSGKEKVYAPQGDKCDGSAIQKNSLCCEGDKYIKCPAGNCHSLIGCPVTHKRAFYGNGKYHCCKAHSAESTLLLPTHEKCSSPAKRKLALKEGLECCDDHIPCPIYCPIPAHFWGAR